MPQTKSKNLKQFAKKIRKEALEMIYRAGSGHLGSAMSTVELLTVLYFANILKYKADNPNWEDRDYFLLSNGHACPTYYAVLAQAGFFSKTKLKNNYFKLNSGLESHPVRDSLPGIETSSGSLGMGLSVGVGIALALRLAKKKNHVFVMMSDGEQQEGSVWEAVMAASHYRLNNLTAIIDRNGIQIAGKTKHNMGLEPLAKKYQSFNWDVVKINGHNLKQIKKAFKKAKKTKTPTVIIAKTIPAKGVYSLEGKEHVHHPVINEKQYQKSIKKLK